MTRQEYEEKLTQLIYKLENETEPSEVEEELKALGNYRPVRFLWQYARVKSDFLQTRDAVAVFDSISGKYSIAYDYPGVSETLQFCCDIQGNLGNRFETMRYGCIQQRLRGGDAACYETAYNACAKVDQTADFMTDFLAYRELYSINELIGYLIRQRARRVRFPKEQPLRGFDWVNQVTNMEYLLWALHKETDIPFVLIESEDNGRMLRLLKEDLCLLGKTVYYIGLPECTRDVNEAARETVFSIEPKTGADGVISFVPEQFEDEEGRRFHNRDDILAYIREECAAGGLLHVLADGYRTEELCMALMEQRCMERIIRVGRDQEERNLALSWYGDYLDYISNIYDMDCRKLLAQDSTIKFSIVIPARNSSAALRYTLHTCLEQTYAGEYEVIISDNSTGHNADVYELCQELNDPRIVYLKTPRDLQLSKSFEYAYLHAKGEYIFALGSDDGLLPWALETLAAVTETYPDEEIIQWERGFYAWPGFNGGQQNQFIIPRAYTKGKFETFYRDNIDYMAAVLKEPREMYTLPMLYINSCFKRTYFQTLLEKTGRLWNGVCQDIYMGVVTACIHEQILNLKYPLTIAGMSSGSVGARSSVGEKTNEEFEKLMQEVHSDESMGGYCALSTECLIFLTGTDTSSLYVTLLRMIGMGILPESYLTEVFDWRGMFLRLASELDIRDVAFDRKLHELRYAAMKHGEEFLSWFDENIYEPMLRPRLLDDNKIRAAEQRKTYTNRRTEAGGMVLDASEYGVENIYDAVQLFVRLSELG